MSPSAEADSAGATTEAPFNWQKDWPGVTLEGTLGLAGAGLLLLACIRWKRWLARKAPAWPWTFLDAMLFVIVVIAAVLAVQLIATAVIRIGHIADLTAIILFGVLTFEAALFLGIGLFHFGYRRLNLNVAPQEPVEPKKPAKLRERLAPLRLGAGLFLATVPVVAIGVNWVWQEILTLCGYPVTAQTLVDVFKGLDTVWARVLFFVFAALVAPITEEIIFRGVLYRAFSKVIPRGWAVVASAALFGAAHRDLSSFVPLFVLGVMFALAYDATGTLVVTIIAHALFNLNTLVALLLGVGS